MQSDANSKQTVSELTELQDAQLVPENCSNCGKSTCLRSEVKYSVRVKEKHGVFPGHSPFSKINLTLNFRSNIRCCQYRFMRNTDPSTMELRLEGEKNVSNYNVVCQLMSVPPLNSKKPLAHRFNNLNLRFHLILKFKAIRHPIFNK